MTIKIKIFSSFCDSEDCKSVFEDICETKNMFNYGEDKDIYITNGDDYTHVIILNTAMPNLVNIPKKNVVGLAFEPPLFLNLTLEFIEYAQKYISTYFIGDKYDLPLPFIQHCAYLSHTIPLTYVPIKNKTMSIMVSQKNFAQGHKYRHLLVQRILSMNLPIDIYGRGCEQYNNYKNTTMQLPNNDFSYDSLLNIHKCDPRLKGTFENTEVYEDYDFHICIENFKTAEYFSEKIMDPLLCGTTPIYWGCKNIDNYFPGYTVQLSGVIDTDILLITHILRDPLKYKKTIDVDFVKDKINLLKNLDDLFS